MRRISVIFSGLLVVVMAQGCGTTNRNKVVISKPGQTTTAPAQPTSEVSPYSSKGGTAAKPGTATVNLSQSSTSSETNAPPKTSSKKVAKAAPPPTPPPAAKTQPAPETTAETTPAESEAPAAKPAKSTTAKAAKPAPPTAAAKPGTTLGAVRQVNTEYKFVVIEFSDENKPLSAGTQLQIWHGGKVVGKVQLEEPIKWPLATASLLEGAPEKDDTVTP